MCGICGTVGFGDKKTLAAMTSAISHRGPDDEGVKIFETRSSKLKRIGLGHRRLAILDLSSAGHQPMANKDGTTWLIFNGEIYNYLTLKQELIKRGYTFNSNTDSEVIIYLYDEFGIDFVHKLNGMFAIAIWDAKNEKLILIRDRLGIKPLYHVYQNGKFIFASEIKAILASGQFHKELNYQALWDYFTFLYVPTPLTIFRDLCQLPPSHYMIIDSKFEMKIQKYWDPINYTFRNSGGRFVFEEHKTMLRNILDDAVKLRLISDVPLGAFLSGGIDSNIVVGLMARNSSSKVKTFTIVFEGDGIEFYNEQAEAKRVHEKFQTDHHELRVEISNCEDLLDMIRHFDQPFGNPTLYLSYLISKYTKEHVTVALSGAGGDELFGGYVRYRALNISNKLKFLPISLLKGINVLLMQVPDDYNKPTLKRLQRFFAGIDTDLSLQYMNWTYFFNDERKHSLLNFKNSALPSKRIIDSYLADASLLEVNNKIEYVDLYTYLADNILTYTDRTSMAVALEVRVPILDYRVVEQSFCIPFGYKLRNGQSKYILKNTFRDLIPNENLKSPKRGFSLPIPKWYEISFDNLFDRKFNKDYLKRMGILNGDSIDTLRRVHKRGKMDCSLELFGILSFLTWYEMYMVENPIYAEYLDCL